MPNSFNCTNGTSYLVIDIFNVTLTVYILIDINSKGFSGGYLFYCVLVIVRQGLSINCDNFCFDAISINSVLVIFRASLLADSHSYTLLRSRLRRSFLCSISVLESVRLASFAQILISAEYVRQCGKSLI